MAFAHHAAVSGTKLCNSFSASLCKSSRCDSIRPGFIQSRLSSRARIYAPAMTISESKTETVQLEQFLKDSEDLGTIRFVSVSNGAVLETVGRFDYARSEFSVPGRGKFITIGSTDKTFECHINVAKVRTITMSKETAKVGGHDIYVIRLKQEDGSIVLSCLLQWDPSQGPGSYLHGAVDAFEALLGKYGESILVSPA